MATPTVLIVGGSGFIGCALAVRLAHSGARVLVPTRRFGQVNAPLRTLPNVEYLPADVHEPAVLVQLMAGVDIVVNLVGILQGSPADFQHAHVDLTRKIIAACQQAG